MFDATVYNEGTLIVGKMSGVVEPQSFINGIFWQIDSRNVGEVKAGFSPLHYDDNISSVTVTEDDVRKIADIKTGMGINAGDFRTALVLQHPEVRRLAKLHQTLAKGHGFEVRIFESIEDGFAWLGYENPNPELIK